MPQQGGYRPKEHHIMSKTLSRITVQVYSAPVGKNAVEYSVDGEPVSMSNPLQLEAQSAPFYYEEPILRPLDGPIEVATREAWLSYEVTRFETGEIFYAHNEAGADAIAYQLAKAHLLDKLINLDKI
jgi:hypothetical protein